MLKKSRKQEVSQLIDKLYNDMEQINDHKTVDIRHSLMQAYRHLDQKDPVVTANRLANYLHFIGYTENVEYTNYQIDLITDLSQIGQQAGLNGSYKTAYGDKSQF